MKSEINSKHRSNRNLLVEFEKKARNLVRLPIASTGREGWIREIERAGAGHSDLVGLRHATFVDAVAAEMPSAKQAARWWQKERSCRWLWAG